MKNRMLHEITESITVFLAENPNADQATIKARFGSPKQIAATYVNEAETEELLEKLRIRRRLLTIVLTLALVLSLSWITTMSYIIHSDEHKVSSSIVYVEVAD